MPTIQTKVSCAYRRRFTEMTVALLEHVPRQQLMDILGLDTEPGI